jgi:hypothetical protein
MTRRAKNSVRVALLALLVLWMLSSCDSPRVSLEWPRQSVCPGERVPLTASLRETGRTGPVRFTWESPECGKFEGGMASYSPDIYWIAPDRSGLCRIWVSVFVDENKIAEKELSVNVFVPEAKASTLDVTQQYPAQAETGDTSINEHEVDHGRSGRSCLAVVCRSNQRCRVTWTAPPGNLGQEPGRDLSGASAVSFWARGLRGTEQIEAFAGDTALNSSTTPYPSTLAPTYAVDPTTGKTLELSANWRQFTIPLSGADLKNLPVLFQVHVLPSSGASTPMTVFVDEISYVR